MTPRPGPLFEAHDLRAALGLLTRLPVPLDHARAGARMGASCWAWPLVGALVGALAGLLQAAALTLGLAPGAAAVAALAAGLILTGALHEDGLADCADGFGGGHDRDSRLEIMRDSRIGSFGAAALILALLAKWDLLRGLGPVEALAALAVSGALARAWLGAALRWVPPARSDGLAATAGRPRMAAAVAGLLIAAAFALAMDPLRGPAAAAAAAIGAGLVLVAGLRAVGGRTGDVLGAGVVLAEIGALAALG